VPVTAQAQAASMTAELLSRFHYAPKPLDDAMSQKIFDRYLKALDGEKLFFLKSDIDLFWPVRDKLDDAHQGARTGNAVCHVRPVPAALA
jgi:carboxyl-terminal processing protease